MSQSRLTYLFNRYINKELTAKEKNELFRWIEMGDADEELKKLLDEFIENIGAEILLPENSGDKILHAIVGKQLERIPIEKKRTLTAWSGIAAASVIIIALFAYFIFNNNNSKLVSETYTVKNAGVSLLHAVTTTGEGKKIRLPDNTEVWLSPSSLLEYPASFNGSLREVKLSGEAFFEVSHDAKHPFIIHSGNIETKVLGTSFNIQAYTSQEEINVTVITGKVNVSNRDKVENVELVANQRAVFHRKSTLLVKENVDTVSAPCLLKRKEGEFVYEGERLRKVMDDLQEYFGVKIEAADAVKDCPISFNVYLTDKIEEILEPIAISINGNLKRNGNVFFVDGTACPEK